MEGAGMPAASALKKESSGSQSSPKEPEASPMEPALPFQRSRLIRELLSLGNPRITSEVALKIGEEVELELKNKPAPRINADFISKIVHFKLQEMGLLKEEEPTESLEKADPPPGANRTSGLLAKGSQTELPTLEKFLRPVDQPKAVEVPYSPPPPRASLKIHEGALNLTLSEKEGVTDRAGAQALWKKRLENVAQVAASAEAKFPSKISCETLAVEFFNTMANQEFYPHLPSLLGDRRSLSYGGDHVFIDLPFGPMSQEQALEDAQAIWKTGGCVTFLLSPCEQGEALNPESFEKFLEAVEKAILDLPDSVSIPRQVGLQFAGNDLHLSDCIQIASSGKFYPKFTFSLVLPPSSQEGLRQTRNRVDSPEQTLGDLPPLLSQLCQRGDARFLLPDSDNLSLALSQDRRQAPTPRWGGGPYLEPYEMCHLGSLNLAILAAGRDVDWAKLRRIIRCAVHFLDNLFEVTEYPLEALAARSRGNRKIALGVMGFAELLGKLGYPYDSEESLVLAEKLMRFIHHESLQASQNLARDRGVFSNYPNSPWKEKGVLIRNASLNGVVASPNLAKLAGVTPGMEAFQSVVEEGSAPGSDSPSPRPLILIKELCTQKKIWSEDLEKEILERKSVRNSPLAPKPLRKLFPTQEEVTRQWQQKIQGAFQRYCDGTIGHPLKISDSSPKEALLKILQEALESGIRQVELEQSGLLQEEISTPTPSEDFSPDIAVAETITTTLPEDSLAAEILGQPEEKESLKSNDEALPRPRPESLRATTRQILTGHGNMTITLGFDDWGPFELHAILGNGGSEESAQAEAISRLASLLFQVGVDPKRIYEKLIGIQCPNTSIDQGQKVLSCADGIAKVLDREFHFSDPKDPTHNPDEEITEVVQKEDLLSDSPD